MFDFKSNMLRSCYQIWMVCLQLLLHCTCSRWMRVQYSQMRQLLHFFITMLQCCFRKINGNHEWKP